MKRWILIVVGLIVLLPLVQAQTPTIPYATGKLVWDSPAPASAVQQHTLRCRAGLVVGPWTHTLNVSMPSTQAQISAVVPTPGPWVCVIVATNSAGTSTESAPAPFVAQPGVPPAPTGLTVVAG